MGQRLGIIAGSSEFPLFLIKEAQKQGYTCVVAAIKNEAESQSVEKADRLEWFGLDGLLNLIAYFKKNEVNDVLFAGKINSLNIFRKKRLGPLELKLLGGAVDKSPTSLIKIIINFFPKQGLRIIGPEKFISTAFCKEGLLTKKNPSPEEKEDISYGWSKAKTCADLDIGQTVVVKDKAIVAVEGMEGTEKAITRGGELAGEGIVVVKVSRTFQDFRIDLPAVGLKTIESLVNAGARALCFEAENMPFLQKEEAIALADENNIAIVVNKD
jgi:DUF1009 family protein